MMVNLGGRTRGKDGELRVWGVGGRVRKRAPFRPFPEKVGWILLDSAPFQYTKHLGNKTMLQMRSLTSSRGHTRKILIIVCFGKNIYDLKEDLKLRCL